MPLVTVALNSNGINRLPAISLDPSVDEIAAARILRAFASVLAAEGHAQPERQLREFAAHTADYARPEQIAQSGA